MDVRCERCKTEYEFDDARITEAGVTVKCTTCGHVFKVKKKALVFTVPVKPGEAESEQGRPAAPPPPPQREWKVRQANGNVFTFKELTTLQKWIVERKVSRDDEISLTGESWKRLGNIAELASFFQVVDEAQKASQLAALQNQAMLGYGAPLVTPAGGYPMPKVPGAPEPTPPYQNQAYRAPTPVQLTPAVAAPQLAPVAPVPVAPAPQAPLPTPAPMPLLQPAVVVLQQPLAQAPAAPGPSAIGRPHRDSREPAFVHSRSMAAEDDDLEAAFRKKGGAGKWIVLLLLLAGGGGGGYWYYFHYLPQQQAAAEAEKARLEAERLAEERAQEEERARAEQERKKKEEAERAAKLAAADAGADAGTVLAAASDAGVKPKPEPVRDFDYWLAQADRLRERERSEAALEAYGKAADLAPDRAEPMAGRGMALLDMGQTLQAEAAFQQALKANSRYGVALMGLAEAYRAQGKKEQAVRYYEKYLDVLPNGAEAPVARNAIERLKQ